MSGTCKSGFTLIEILIAMAIVALIAVAVAPNLGRRTPEYERKQLISQLNNLTHLAWQRAMATGKVHKILFNLTGAQVELQQETTKKADNGEAIFEPITGLYFSRSFAWPRTLQIKQFFVEGSNLMEQFAGRPSENVWFFIVPEGLAQAVTINMLDTKDLLPSKKPRPVGLVLNPFSAQFSVYDQFQK